MISASCKVGLVFHGRWYAARTLYFPVADVERSVDTLRNMMARPSRLQMAKLGKNPLL